MARKPESTIIREALRNPHQPRNPDASTKKQAPKSSHQTHNSDSSFIAKKVHKDSLFRSPARASPLAKEVLDQHHIVATSKSNPAMPAIDMLRTQVLQKMRKEEWRILGITSPMPQCGKTTVAINLAMSIAKWVQKTAVLVDFDLRNPSIGRYLGIRSTPDLSDYLEGRAPFESTVVSPGIPRLLILPNDKAYQNSSEMLTTREATSIVHRLRTAEDVQVAILDLPPVLPTDDTLSILPEIDCLLVVLMDGTSTKPELKETQRLLERANVMGYVLNNSMRASNLGYPSQY